MLSLSPRLILFSRYAACFSFFDSATYANATLASCRRFDTLITSAAKELTPRQPGAYGAYCWRA
jgi:hypothetical protein